MTTAPAVPRSLHRWAAPLAALDAALAVRLGPMLHVLDELITRLDDGSGATGEPDGYDGTTNRGDPERLLVSEWALADEVPLEFVRRAAENELSYLRRAYRAPASSGRLLVVVDAGPEQLGPGRLVQLAALVVLARKALTTGAELAVRVLQSPETLTGTLPHILSGWLRARSARPATPDQLAAALAEAEADDRVWLLLGPGSARLAPEHRRTLTSWVTGWSGDRAGEITVRVGNATTRLVLPEARTSVAALRGEGLLARRGDTRALRVPTTGRGAVFGSADPRLLWRGEEDDEVYALQVGPGVTGARPKRHRTSGRILAAASLGRRLVLAVADGSHLRIRVIGKKLARVEAIEVSLEELGLDADGVDAVLASPLQPLYLHGGSILLQLAGTWWLLEPDARPYRQSLYRVAPGSALDAPRILWSHEDRIRLGSVGIVRVDQLHGVVFGPTNWSKPWLAWSTDSRVWTIARDDAITDEIGVGEGERVLGLTVVGSEPALVVVSSGGIIVRHVTPRTTRTWTRWAGPAHYELHPFRPWLARTTEDRITVGDLSTGQNLVDIGREP